MEDAMPRYRCYHINSDGHFVDVEEIDASTDSEAWVCADQIVAVKKWKVSELWDRERKVVRRPVT
jgi:hypothetical protein